MPDREKVIRWLEACSTGCEYGCPYEYEGTVLRYECKADLMRDALELLKAQQKTPVVFKQYDGSIESECGNCGLYLDKAYSVCPKCGKGLNWNA